MEALRAQIDRLEAERLRERKAYNAFVIQCLQVHNGLPPEAKTQHYLEAFTNLNELSREVTDAGRVADETKRNGSAALGPCRNAHVSVARENEIKIQLQEMVDVMRQAQRTLWYLAQRRPAESHGLRHDTHIDNLINKAQALQANAATFASMLTAYLNGRHACLDHGLRLKLKDLVEPFFDDPRDAKALISAIIQAVDSVENVDRAELAPLSRDLLGPTSEVVDALVNILEHASELVPAAHTNEADASGRIS